MSEEDEKKDENSHSEKKSEVPKPSKQAYVMKKKKEKKKKRKKTKKKLRKRIKKEEVEEKYVSKPFTGTIGDDWCAKGTEKNAVVFPVQVSRKKSKKIVKISGPEMLYYSTKERRMMLKREYFLSKGLSVKYVLWNYILPLFRSNNRRYLYLFLDEKSANKSMAREREKKRKSESRFYRFCSSNTFRWDEKLEQRFQTDFWRNRVKFFDVVLPKELNDDNIALISVMINWRIVKILPKNMKMRVNIIITALEESLRVLDFFDRKELLAIFNHEEIVLKLIQIYRRDRNLEYVYLQKKFHGIKDGVYESNVCRIEPHDDTEDYGRYGLGFTRMRKVKYLVGGGSHRKKKYSIGYERVEEKGAIFEFVSPRLRSKKEFVMKAVALDGFCLRFVSEKLQRDKDVVIEAVKDHGFALQFACKKMRRNKYFVKKVVSMKGKALKFASESLQKDKEIVLVAAWNDKESIRYAKRLSESTKNKILAEVERCKVNGRLNHSNETFKKHIEQMKNQRRGYERRISDLEERIYSEMKKSRRLLWKKENEIRNLKMSLSNLHVSPKKRSKQVTQRLTRIGRYLLELQKEEMLLIDESMHFRERYYVGVNQKIDKITFHDTGRTKQYRDLGQRKEEELLDVFFETIVYNSRVDKEVRKFMSDIERKFTPRMTLLHSEIRKNDESSSSKKDNNIVSDFFRDLIASVSDFFGGIDVSIDEKCDKKIRKLKKKKKSNIIYLGELKGNGVCRHRSILFKAVCDRLDIRCRLHRGWFRDPKEEIKHSHCWNMVQLGSQFFLVDVMRSLSLIPFQGEVNADSATSSENYIEMGGLSQEIEIEKINMKLINEDYRDNREPKGNGKFGSVYEVEVSLVDTYKSEEEYTTRKEFIAVKEINLSQLSETFGRDYFKKCEREIMYMKCFDHPNIVRYVGSFRRSFLSRRTKKRNEVLCMCMELYDCTAYSFKKKMFSQENGSRKIPLDHRLREMFIFLIDVCKALRYIHSVGVAHMDLHPNNILVRWNQQNMEIINVALSDFGGSKQMNNHGFIKTTLPGGALLFSAPEIKKLLTNSCSSRMKEDSEDYYKFSEKSDIYSLGMVMEQLFLELYEGFPGVLTLQKKCLSENPEDRPGLNEMIYCFVNMLRYLDQKSGGY